jgi:hypothetical protein
MAEALLHSRGDWLILANVNLCKPDHSRTEDGHQNDRVATPHDGRDAACEFPPVFGVGRLETNQAIRDALNMKGMELVVQVAQRLHVTRDGGSNLDVTHQRIVFRFNRPAHHVHGATGAAVHRDGLVRTPQLL